MSDAPRQTLRELINRYGPGLCSDARRCEGLLRDLCGAHRREINILLGALRERVPLDLLAARNSVPRDLLLTRLSKRLEDHLALTEGAARWAVDSWALALGIVSDAEVEERTRRSAETAAPPLENKRQGGGPPAVPNTRSPASPPRTQQGPPPPPVQARRPSPPPAPRPPPVLSPPAARQTTTAPASRAPSSPQAASTGPLQTPPPAPRAEGRRGRWRGGLVGCLLLILLSALLFVGGPYVFNLLREEQRQRSLEPPPVQTR